MDGKEKKWKGKDILYVLYLAGVVALIVWLFIGGAKSAEGKAQKKQSTREDEIAAEVRRETIQEMEEKMPDLESILVDAYNPDDLIYEAQEGYYTAEEVARMYKELYDRVEAEWKKAR